MGMNFGMGYNPLINPNLSPQQRVMQYEQQMQMQAQMQPPMQQNPMQMQVQMQAPAQSIIKPFYVTSRQEAEASQTPFDGSIHIYLNTAKNEIYTKKLMNDGSADFRVYKTSKINSQVKEEIETETEKETENTQHIEKIDLSPLLTRLDAHEKRFSDIEGELERINKYPINKNKKEVKNDE